MHIGINQIVNNKSKCWLKIQALCTFFWEYIVPPIAYDIMPNWI
jgi:hypothetical protein